MEPQIQTALSGGGTPAQGLTTTTDKESMMAEAQPIPDLTPPQRIQLARSILGHVAEDDEPDRIEAAIRSASRALAGEDLLAGDGL